MLLVPAPVDSAILDFTAWVAIGEATGRLCWADSSWAWNPDTLNPAEWILRLSPTLPLYSVDLDLNRGAMIHWPMNNLQEEGWEPTREEGLSEGVRFRVFESELDSIWCIGGVPSAQARLIADWHQTLGLAARPLLPLPGKSFPVQFSGATGAHWAMQSRMENQVTIPLSGVLIYDPNRTIMDVVRERNL